MTAFFQIVVFTPPGHLWTNRSLLQNRSKICFATKIWYICGKTIWIAPHCFGTVIKTLENKTFAPMIGDCGASPQWLLSVCRLVDGEAQGGGKVSPSIDMA